jgi:hypothetical protein
MQTEPEKSAQSGGPTPGEPGYEEYKKTTEEPADLEQAHPYEEKPTAEEEPQEARGAPGSSGEGARDESR